MIFKVRTRGKRGNKSPKNVKRAFPFSRQGNFKVCPVAIDSEMFNLWYTTWTWCEIALVFSQGSSFWEQDFIERRMASDPCSLL
jgi:hypothetical protein